MRSTCRSCPGCRVTNAGPGGSGCCWGAWRVELTPAAPTLVPDEQITVRAIVHPPDDFRGRQAVNVNAFLANATGAVGPAGGLAGGVTLTVVRD